MTWSGRHAQKWRKAVLARGFDYDRGFTPCHWCGMPADSADHYPVSRADGGPDTLANMVPACIPCNSRRGAVQGNHARTRPAPPSRDW